MPFGFRFSDASSLEELPVRKYAMSYDEGANAFVPFATAPEGEPAWMEELGASTIADELYCRAFLDLDPEDTSSLLAFQNQHGPLVSPMRRLDKVIIRGHSYFAMEHAPAFDAVSDRLSRERDSIGRTRSAWESYRELHSEMNPYMSMLAPSYFVSLEEAQASVINAQDAIRTLVRVSRMEVLTEGEADSTWDAIDNKNIELAARSCTAHVSKCIAPYLPIIDYVPDGSSPNDAPVIVAVLAQLVAAITSGDAFKECPQCHKVFQWKMRDDGIHSSRNPNAKYCSDECARLADQGKENARKRERRRKARKAKRA